MNRSTQLDSFIPSRRAIPAIGRAILPAMRLAALGAAMGSLSLLQAQNSFLASNENAHKIHFGAPTSDSEFSSLNSGQSHARRSLFSIGTLFGVHPRSRSIFNPPQPIPDTNRRSGSSASLRFAGSELSPVPELPEVLSQFSDIPVSTRSDTSVALFSLTSDASPVPAGNARSLFSAPPSNPLPLDELMRSASTEPLLPPIDAVRFPYQDALNPGGKLSDLGRGNRSYGTAVLTSSNLGYGVLFSVGGPMHSGSSANLKLTF
jgi:hypothetical protein